FASSRIDARLLSADETPNFAYVTSVAGGALCTVSVDAGTSWALADVDGRPVWACDARGTVSTWTYDTLGRPLTAIETVGDTAPAVRDAWIYGEAEADAQAHNLRGHCVRRYDSAGRLTWSGFRLTSAPLAETRQLLAGAEADWAGNDEAKWPRVLEPTSYTTTWTHDATGAWLTQTDAKGNVQACAHDVAGQLARNSLTLAGGGTAQPVLRSIEYSAAGQVLSETAGNSMVSTYEYEPETQRLTRLTVTRPAQAGRARVLQDLHYIYDPVGNVLSVHDDAQATTYWRNQQVDSTRIYTYDALYQLMSATGREAVQRGPQGAALPLPTIPLPNDNSVYTNYARTYTYDRGGNLTGIQHRGAASYSYIQAIVVSDRSNHALQQNAEGTIVPADVDDGTWFDAAGNQQVLLPDRTQPLAWNGRNRLAGVTLVQRDGGIDDRETYQYGADGMRARKRTTTHTSGTTRTAEAIVLPGLTLRVTRSDDGQTVKVVEALQEVRLDAGRAGARALHWETGLPAGLANDALRFSHGDLIGSVGLELDAQADLISREEYYPYGGTAVWTARSQAETDTKYVRYSGMERDATGLYDYGWRSYQPWLGRWLNPDPAGAIDGQNLYRMVANRPIILRDSLGLAPQPLDDEHSYAQLANAFRVGDIVYGLDVPRKNALFVLKNQGFSRVGGNFTQNGKPLRWIKSIMPKSWRSPKRNILTQNDITNAVWNQERPNDYTEDREISKNLHDSARAISFKNFLESHGRYNVKNDPLTKRHPLDAVEIFKKTSKAGLEFQILKRKMVVHFVVDVIEENIEVVAKKEKGYGQSITSSELRWLYRHRELWQIKKYVNFWKEDGLVDQDKFFSRCEWSAYQPKNRGAKENKINQ
ncbi:MULTISPECIES: RHS repeat-associated core domain-containing protein, partial [unclassified Burkholderia]